MNIRDFWVTRGRLYSAVSLFWRAQRTWKYETQATEVVVFLLLLLLFVMFPLFCSFLFVWFCFCFYERLIFVNGNILTNYRVKKSVWSGSHSTNLYSRLPITRTFKGNRKKFELSGVRVIGSSKKIAESRVKTSFYCTVNILITLILYAEMLSENWKILSHYKSQRIT